MRPVASDGVLAGEVGVVGAEPVDGADGLVDAVVGGQLGEAGVVAQVAEGQSEGGEAAVIELAGGAVLGEPGEVVAEVGELLVVAGAGVQAEPGALVEQVLDDRGDVVVVAADPGCAGRLEAGGGPSGAGGVDVGAALGAGSVAVAAQRVGGAVAGGGERVVVLERWCSASRASRRSR